MQSGTLVEASHLPVYDVTDQRQSTTSVQPVTRTVKSLLTGLRQHCTDSACQQPSVCQQARADNIPVVVCSASLAGSWDDDDEFSDCVELSSDVDVDKLVIDHLLATAQTIVDCGAALLACQKVSTVFFSFTDVCDVCC